MVKVYDLRMLKALPPVQYIKGPSFLKIVPTVPSLLYSCTNRGQFQLTDINTSQSSLWDEVCMLINHRLLHLGIFPQCPCLAPGISYNLEISMEILFSKISKICQK